MASTDCAASVTFSPTATSDGTGALTFIDDAGNNPQIVSLTGTGSAPGTLQSPDDAARSQQIVNRTGIRR